MAKQHLDCKHLNCPMPIVRISQAIKKLDNGDLLEVEASDPAFKADLEAWVEKMGHEILEFHDGENVRRAVVRKS